MRDSSAMRIFFIKASSFVVGISLIFNVLGSLADKIAPLDDWRIEHQQRYANLEARRDRIEAITLGNSHSDSIDYSVLGIEGQSLAFAAADLFEVEQYAALMADELPNLKIVFVAISYYSFSRDNATFEPFRTRRIRFYSMVPTWSPIQRDLPNFWLGKLEATTHMMSVVRSDSWQGVWTELANDGPAKEPFPYDGVHTDSVWGNCLHYTQEQLETHAREIAGRNVSSSTEMAAVHPGLMQDAFNALARTIERLHSRGIQVILFTPTYYQKYNAYFGEQGADIIADMQQTIYRLQQNYQVEYYDFSGDSEIKDQPELFYNSDHLNECGQKVITMKLQKAMNGNSEK